MRALVAAVVTLPVAKWPLDRGWGEVTQWRWVTIRDQAHGFPFWAMVRIRPTS
jgi:hypothetical protein